MDTLYLASVGRGIENFLALLSSIGFLHGGEYLGSLFAEWHLLLAFLPLLAPHHAFVFRVRHHRAIGHSVHWHLRCFFLWHVSPLPIRLLPS